MGFEIVKTEEINDKLLSTLDLLAGAFNAETKKDHNLCLIYKKTLEDAKRDKVVLYLSGSNKGLADDLLAIRKIDFESFSDKYTAFYTDLLAEYSNIDLAAEQKKQDTQSEVTCACCLAKLGV
jgi:hypothetical protein